MLDTSITLLHLLVWVMLLDCRQKLSAQVVNLGSNQSWILTMWVMQVGGGFRDKPGKYRDHYHTCYCLSGLSVCQYSWSDDVESPPLPAAVLGPYSNNLVEPIHPLYNVVFEQYKEAHEFFSRSS